MILKIMTLITGLLTTTVTEHDVAIAIFRMTETSEATIVEITLDEQDIAYELNELHVPYDHKNIEQYLTANFQIFADSNIAQYEVTAITKQSNHLHITARLSKHLTHYSTLQIVNRCFVSIPDHSNIIQLELNNEVRDYRMHKTRQTIEVQYDKY